MSSKRSPNKRRYVKRLSSASQRSCVERLDLPHLRNKGKWSVPCERNWLCCCPKCRIEMYLHILIDAGVPEIDAWNMVADLYWDCFEELRRSGRPIEENGLYC